MNTATNQANLQSETNSIELSKVTHGNPMKIREGFNALGFRHSSFDGLMDPLIMVDHYTMTRPTFGAHPHAGLSAVSLLFEDSIGKFHNRDSLGNDFDLLPGDLYWLNSGRGVVHDEAPRDGAEIHGLQVFVNLPKSLKHSDSTSNLVRATQMPLLTAPDYRVRIAIGESNGVKGATISPNNLTILDGKLFAAGRFEHQPQFNEQSWIYAVAGSIDIAIGGRILTLESGQAVALKSSGHAIEVINAVQDEAHFVLFSGVAIGESFFQRGPFVMSSEEELDRVQRDYENGLLGTLK
ncbi:pirin family protein [Planctobacterium marinum]|uniref:Pirin n=1 Tax=Planctobacterium marinum TaxID=1631968 RepID=A0AA48HJL4_9ALTE|nr:hypothetical protein MACH26_35840 [Planctobacterium marinum]